MHLKKNQFFIPIFVSCLSLAQAKITSVNKPKDFDSKDFDQKRYEPTWESLDSRPLPNWYDESKIGILVTWGVFTVPGFGSEWFWQFWKSGNQPYVNYMRENHPPGFTYQDFGPQFTAEFYDPEKWATLFSKAGAKYVVMMTKHHDGFTLYPSQYSFGWNARDIGPKRDLVGALADAIRTNTTLRFGLYHSLYEWFNPLYLDDAKNNFTTNEFIKYKTMPELYELVREYNPDIIWSDGDYASADYWKSKEFLAWLYNDSQVKDTVVTNDRWGTGCSCKHGGFMTCSDRYNPGILNPRKWENCMTIDRYSWGFRREAQIQDFLTAGELISTVIETVACGGNVLINVAPTKEGIISPLQEERLLQLGEWLDLNGEAIYKTIPWTHQNDTITPDIWYTSTANKERIYAMTLKWPANSKIILGAIKLAEVNIRNIQMLGTHAGDLRWEKRLADEGIAVWLPSLELVKSQFAWTLVINQN